MIKMQLKHKIKYHYNFIDKLKRKNKIVKLIIT